MDTVNFKQSDSVKSALQEAIQVLVNTKTALITFSPKKKKSIILTVIKDGTDEAKKAVTENLVLYPVKEQGVQYLVCR